MRHTVLADRGYQIPLIRTPAGRYANCAILRAMPSPAVCGTATGTLRHTGELAFVSCETLSVLSWSALTGSNQKHTLEVTWKEMLRR